MILVFLTICGATQVLIRILLTTEADNHRAVRFVYT